MSKFKDASETIKRLQVMFAGLNELADAMDKVDSLESYAVELEDKKSKLFNECEALKESKEVLEKEFEVAKDKAPSVILETETRAAQLVEDAKAKAAQIVADAQSKSKEIDTLIDDKIKKYDAKLQGLVLEIKASEKKVSASELKLKEVNEALEKIIEITQIVGE